MANDTNRLWKLKDITTKISDGIHGTPKYSTGTGIFFINGNNLVDGEIRISRSTKEVDLNEYEKHKKLLDGSTILMSINGTIGSLALYNGEQIVLGKSAAYINCADDLERKYLYYFLLCDQTRARLLDELTGSTIKNLSLQSIKDLQILTPPIPVQQRIVAMLETCDKLINVSQVTIRVKRRLKDGLAEGLLTGAIRLPGFRSNWGSLKLGEVCTRINRKNSELNQNALTISAQDGLVAQGEYFSKRIAAIDLSGYLLLHNGEFAYNKSYSKGYPMGAIKRLNAYKKGAVSTLYLAFTPTRIESDYLQHYFEQGLFNKVLSTVTQEGARNHGLLNISAVDFFDADVYVPLEPEEQIAIAQILTAVDDEITTLERKLAIIKTQRKYLLNNLVTGKIRVPETLKPLAKEPTHA